MIKTWIYPAYDDLNMCAIAFSKMFEKKRDRFPKCLKKEDEICKQNLDGFGL